jgi:hypothetical protein
MRVLRAIKGILMIPVTFLSLLYYISLRRGH